MSLIKQLWLGIIALLLIAFMSSFFVSVYNAKSYFEEQLNLKNNDNAQSLALSLSQMDKEPVMVELFIAAQFDTGYYRRIELQDPLGEPIQRRIFDEGATLSVPDWFERFIALEVHPGVAQVQEGWQQFGTVYVESHDRFAYEALWQSTLQLAGWLLFIALVSGGLGTWLLKTLIRPLDFVVAQAEAMGDRRFLMGDEPKTLEFGRLVRAMNKLSGRIKAMLEKESQRLASLRESVAMDRTTGCLNRDFLMGQLDAVLADQENQALHGVLIIRAKALQEKNQQLGRHQVDEQLKHLVRLITQALQADVNAQASVGRLNGTDFVVLLPDALTNQQAWCQALAAQLYSADIDYAMAYSRFRCDEVRGHLLARLDSLLVRAEQQMGTALEYATESKDEASAVVLTETDWAQCLQAALDERNEQVLSFVLYPTQDSAGQIYHLEAMMRLSCQAQDQQQMLTAWQVLPWAKRFKQVAELDERVLQRALLLLQADAQLRLAINVSVTTLVIERVRMRLVAQLSGVAPSVVARLAIELNEQDAIEQLDAVKAGLLAVQQAGCQLGLEKVSARLLKTAQVQELGLDYLKVDSVYVREFMASHQGDYLRGMIKLGHTLGMTMIAEGVIDPAEIAPLLSLGFDGVTGPGVR